MSNKIKAKNNPSSLTSSLYKKNSRPKIKTSSKYKCNPNKSNTKSELGGKFLENLPFSIFSLLEKELDFKFSQ